MGTLMPRIAIPKGIGHPCFQRLTVTSSSYDMRNVTNASVKLVKSGAVVKTWSFSPSDETTEGSFVGHHDFEATDADTEGTFSLVVELTADGGTIPVKCADHVRIFDPLKEP
jgi:hypothetical protein